MIAKSVEINENVREGALDECCSIAESIIEEMQFMEVAGKKSAHLARMARHKEFLTRRILKHIFWGMWQR